ncbi:MAG: hypothetical protein NC185_05080 [Ruminococcus sp.]|nr:hypothetical protein [Ruminococcus sp.]
MKTVLDCLEKEKFNCICDYDSGEINASKNISGIFYARLTVLFREIHCMDDIQKIASNINNSKAIPVVLCHTDLNMTEDFCTYITQNGRNIIHFVYVNKDENKAVYSRVHYHGSGYVKKVTDAFVGFNIQNG